MNGEARSARDGALRASALEHPLAFSWGLTVVWWAVIAGVAYGLPRVQPTWFPDAIPTLVNLVALAIPLAVIARWRWWTRTGVAAVRPERSWALVAPILVVKLTQLAFGVPSGTAIAMTSTAALMLALGANEEILNRGLILEVLRRSGAARAVFWNGVIFGVAHVGNFVFFGRPLADTLAQIVAATASGWALAAARLHVVSVWPFVLIHALGNWLNTTTPGERPVWWWVGQVLVHVLYALWLVGRRKETR